jgi:major membrane immunogen (membrane-anchored lipoprotein)
VGKLRAEVASLSAALKENRTAQLESRLNTLADSLVEKQGLIDQLISEKVRVWMSAR